MSAESSRPRGHQADLVWRLKQSPEKCAAKTSHRGVLSLWDDRIRPSGHRRPSLSNTLPSWGKRCKFINNTSRLRNIICFTISSAFSHPDQITLLRDQWLQLPVQVMFRSYFITPYLQVAVKSICSMKHISLSSLKTRETFWQDRLDEFVLITVMWHWELWLA